jgi:hypothetical protein
MDETHIGLVGDHYQANTIVQKIILEGLWWPILHNNFHKKVKQCDICQRMC